MEKYDWSRFTRRIDIYAPFERLKYAWTTQSGLEAWFLRSAQFSSFEGERIPPEQTVKPGDQYDWLWHGWPDTTQESGVMLETSNPEILKFSFGGEATHPIIVTVSLKVEHVVSVLELTQENIPDTEDARVNYHLGCCEGWGFYLVNLKSFLEGGIDLRNKDVTMENMINK